jgi:phage gp36-like protein
MVALFFTQADLERAAGGAAVIVKLLDKDEDGVADADHVEAVLVAGSSEIASYIQKTVELSSLTAPYPSALVLKAADCGVFHAWVRGSEGQAVPPNVQALYDAAIRWAVDVGRRQATLGVVPKPGLDPPAKLVDADPAGMGISRRGFARGFR